MVINPRQMLVRVAQLSNIANLHGTHSYQEALEHNEILSTVINIIPDIIFLKDLQGRYVLVNDAYARSVGRTPDQVIGKTTFDLFPHDEAQTYHEIDLENMRRGQPLIDLMVEATWHETGERRMLLMNQLPLRNAAGDVVGIVGIGRDLTDRFEMEQALRYQANLMQNVSDAIIATDTDFVVQSWNEAAAQIYGIPATKALGRFMNQLITTEYLYPTTREHAIQALKQNGRWSSEVVQVTQDGRRLQIQSSVTQLLDASETVIGYVAVNRDITVYRETEAALLENELALMHERELNAMKSRIMSLVSHEFRTPLTIIQASGDLLRRYWSRMNETKRQGHFDKISSQIDRLDRLISDFGLMIQAETGHLQFNPETLNLQEFCASMIEEFKAILVDEQALTLRIAEPITCQADPHLLGYMLRNLISNAIKYSPAGGEIQLSVQVIDQLVVFQVSDQGIGIPPESLARLFEAYHRADNVGQIRGTGLGLNIVKHCVELHGGKIEVQSVVRQGSTFTISLPYQSRQQLQNPVESSLAS